MISLNKKEFIEQERFHLRLQLSHYIVDIPLSFQNITTLYDANN